MKLLADKKKMVQYMHHNTVAALLVINSFCAWKCEHFLNML